MLAPIYACLRRGPRGCLRRECCTGGESVTEPRVNRSLAPIINAEHEARQAASSLRLRYDPTGNLTRPTSFGGACTTNCTTQPVKMKVRCLNWYIFHNKNKCLSLQELYDIKPWCKYIRHSICVYFYYFAKRTSFASIQLIRVTISTLVKEHFSRVMKKEPRTVLKVICLYTLISNKLFFGHLTEGHVLILDLPDTIPAEVD